MKKEELILDVLLGILILIAALYASQEEATESEEEVESVSSTIYPSTTTEETSIDKYDPKLVSVLICDRSKLLIRCHHPASLTTSFGIKIIKAEYGRTDNQICTDQKSQDSNCGFINVTRKVVKRFECDGKIGCHIDASSFHYKDPCPQTSKYLKVQYKCIANDTTPASTTENST